MDISEDLKAQAIKLGLCSPWQAEWDKPTKDELVEMYVRGIDFAIEHDYPSLEYMVRNFDDVMNDHGVYVSQEFHLENQKIVIANGKCFGEITYNGFATGRIYARHESELVVYVKGSSKVFISVYDNAKVTVIQDGLSKAYVYKRGKVKVDCVGDVLVREWDNKKARPLPLQI